MEWVQSISDRFAAFDAYGRTLPAPFEERGFQGAPLLATIAASFAFHYAIFLNAMPAKLDACARSRVASLAHSIISVVCVSAWLAKHEVRLYDPEFAPRLMHGVDGTGDEWLPYFTSISVGYFIADTLVMLLYKEAYDKGGVFHHLVIGPAFMIGLLARVTVPYNAYYLLEELSTIPLNFKSFCTRDSPMHKLFSYSFAALFFFSRFVIGLYLYFSIFFVLAAMRHCLTTTQFVVFGLQFTACTVSRALNSYWLAIIVSKLLEMVTGKKSKRKKGERTPKME